MDFLETCDTPTGHGATSGADFFKKKSTVELIKYLNPDCGIVDHWICHMRPSYLTIWVAKIAGKKQ